MPLNTCVKSTLNVKGKLFSLERPLVMGVLNVTPDSFYAKSRSQDHHDLLNKCEEMLGLGASVIDIGGHSTRPGAEKVTEEEEIKRVVPAISLIIKEFPEAVLSIDTYRSGVAREAIEAGASIINDISGGQLDAQMFDTVSQLRVPYILGHMKGDFDTMMTRTDYEDLLTEVFDFFSSKIDQLQKLDVNDIIVDPGFGFSKSLDQNYLLLKNLGYFINLERPLLVGFSRKSMIYKLLEISPDEALNGTTALNMVGLSKGASVLRVHDVKEAIETVKLFNQLNQ